MSRGANAQCPQFLKCSMLQTVEGNNRYEPKSGHDWVSNETVRS